MSDQNSVRASFSKTFRNSGNGAFSRQNSYSVNLGKCATTIRSGTYSVNLATSKLRIRLEDVLLQNFQEFGKRGIFKAKSDTGLIWENMRSEFGPAHRESLLIGPITSGTPISPPCPRPPAFGPPGCHFRCRSAGPFAGGWRSCLTTTRVASWGMRRFSSRPALRRFDSFLAGPSTAPAPRPNTSLLTAAPKSPRQVKPRCKRHGLRQRKGAIGQTGNIALLERALIRRSSPAARGCSQLFRCSASRSNANSIILFVDNAARPHMSLQIATPNEVYTDDRPACRRPRFEPRAAWPRGSPCAAPQVLVKGQPGAILNIKATFLAGRKHLPLVKLSRVA